ncbi:MAG: GIY-YIG nuclease family protein [Thermoprotei archaeon]
MILRVRESCKVEVGSLGLIDVVKGYYAYVGSAKRGVLKRLMRHFSRMKKRRWHIDYLTSLEFVDVVVSFILFGRDEKSLAGLFSRKFNFVRGFGCSDDRVNPSHLFYLGEFDSLDNVVVFVFENLIF